MRGADGDHAADPAFGVEPARDVACVKAAHAMPNQYQMPMGQGREEAGDAPPPIGDAAGPRRIADDHVSAGGGEGLANWRQAPPVGLRR